jgi:hypothetical protein
VLPRPQRAESSSKPETVMQIPTLKLKPPPLYGDLRELETTFATLIPLLTPQLASLLGKRTPKSNKKDTRALKRKLHRFLLSSRPYLLGLQALKQGPDHHKCSYALLEGLLKEHFRAVGKRVSDNQDAFQMLLKQTEQIGSTRFDLGFLASIVDLKRDCLTGFNGHVAGRSHAWLSRRRLRFGLHWVSS